MRDHYDIIVIGGGHAGTEAAWAAAAALESAGGRVALITMDPARIGQMSCNPAIGGLGKGQIVREIDALGGIMGRAIDATGIMFKMLNTSKGAAVRGPRAQADKYAYAAEVQRILSTRPNIDVIAGTIDDIVVEQGQVIGVRIPAGAGVVTAHKGAIESNIRADCRATAVYPSQSSEPTTEAMMLRSCAVVLTTGTFMRGLMHTGETRTTGGRIGEAAATGISTTLQELGFELGRLKTGTPPRLARESIEWESLEVQVGDAVPVPFSDMTPSVLPAGRFPHLAQSECRITHTTAAAHDVIRANLDRAPMYSGQMEAECGPRYCPSIEDKVVRFGSRDSHHVFLEPESLFTNEVYCNGISTSLPIDVQQQIVQLMPGCANAHVQKWGYAVEYDMVWPHQIDSTCMTKAVHGLFFAGQINCTTGYEEAGAQGLVAGVNAARMARDEELVRLQRDQAYIGVMLDDLVTKTPREPYRMFTSRAEYRLLLRAENSDERLTPLGRELGLVDDCRWRVFERTQQTLDVIRNQFNTVLVDGKALRQIARRPECTAEEILAALDGSFDLSNVQRVLTEARYEGYINRQRAEVKRQTGGAHRCIPGWLDPASVPGLRSEAVDVLTRFQPTTMGQAARLAGISPADLTLLSIAIEKRRRARHGNPGAVPVGP